MSPSHAVLAVGVVFGIATIGRADPKPLSKAEQAKVDKAVEKGIAYLKRMQTKEDNWPTHWRGRFLVGECALPAYALLEAGVSAKDPVIQKAAAFIRPKVAHTDDTYELSLAVLFFDRLGDPKDKKLIQTCALRLIAGQFWTGGWSYICPRFKDGQETDLLEALRGLSKQMQEEKTIKEAVKELKLSANVLVWPREPPEPEANSRIDYDKLRSKINSYKLPLRLRGLKGLTVFQDLEKFNGRERTQKNSKESIPLIGVTDNSNTQFALLALWVSQRYGIPTEPTFRLLVDRFERSQYLSGDWRYRFTNFLKEKNESRRGRPSMICVGLLGLAIGRGLELPSASKAQPLDMADTRILNGLAALYTVVGTPTGQMAEAVLPEWRQDVYFLWSVERVGMLFNLPTLGDKEWYRWGVELLLANQLDSGEFNAVDWSENPRYTPKIRGFYGPVLKSAFALLFLKHSHPMKDLTPKLPFTAKKLNEGIMRLRNSDSRLERTITAPSRNTKPDR